MRLCTFLDIYLEGPDGRHRFAPKEWWLASFAFLTILYVLHYMHQQLGSALAAHASSFSPAFLRCMWPGCDTAHYAHMDLDVVLPILQGACVLAIFYAQSLCGHKDAAQQPACAVLGH